MRTLAFIAFSLTTALFASGQLAAGPADVAFPEEYQDSFVKYLDVDNYSRSQVRFMYVDPEADATVKPDQELPDGTVLVMENHAAKMDASGEFLKDEEGRLIPEDPIVGIFVMEKNKAWETDNEHWDYAWYLPDGTLNPEFDKYEACFSCHASRAERDYTFTYWKVISDRGK